MPDAIFTIGHSNRSAPVFLGMLQAQGITLLADVRKIPRSRFNPHFNDSLLARELSAHGIRYLHLPQLGGKRAPSPHSPNTWFRPDGGLQSYADYMASGPFEHAIKLLLAEAASHRTAVMCAEAKPENCHRQLIADALLVRGQPVIHMVRADETRPHAMHPAAQLDAEGHLIYPAQDKQLEML